MKIQELLESRYEEDEVVESTETSEVIEDEYPDAAFPGEDIGWILFRREELARQRYEEDEN